MRFLLLFSLFTLVSACSDAPLPTSKTDGPAKFVSQSKFADYWYQGKAELTSYDLQQARYGEIHPGEAVLVFVTEPFSRSKQVKLDGPSASSNDKVSVFKMNMTRKFFTGIYPYSMMTSAFSPIDRSIDPHALKITTSSQEWCGHTFTQLNLRGKNYQFQQFSYFESEGDEKRQLKEALAEDDLWNLIRTNPGLLPEGPLQLIPSTMHSRLSHRPLKAEKATAKTIENKNNPDWLTYQVDYPDANRQLEIYFQKSFPYGIQGWQERNRSGFGPNARELVTTAKIKKRINLAYWNHNDLADAVYRDQLELKSW